MSPVFWGVIAYVAMQLVVGMLVSRKIRSESDYLLAGRSFGYPLAIFSIFATWFGAETCIGAAGAIYENGLSGAHADPFGYAICLLCMGLFFAVPLWNRKLTTMADLFRQRYSTGVERVAAIIMFPTSVIWAAAQIRAFGQVLAQTSDLQVLTCITIAAAVVIIYTASGGLLADAMTDIVQGIVLIIGLAVLLFAVAAANGGFAALAAQIEPQKLNPFDSSRTAWWEQIENWSIPIFGSMVAQELVSRVIAARSAIVARRSTLYAASIYLTIGLIPAFLGLVGASMYPGLEDPEHILPHLAETYLPTFLYIVFAGALISAILSTVDSALLSASALLSHNVIVSRRPMMADRTKLLLARSGVIILGVIAYFLAIRGGSIYELVESASAFGSAGIVIIFLFGLYTKFGGARSAIAALIAGAATWVVLNFIFESSVAYISSLLTALLTYTVAALFEQRAMRGYA